MTEGKNHTAGFHHLIHESLKYVSSGVLFVKMLYHTMNTGNLFVLRGSVSVKDVKNVIKIIF